MKILIVGAGAVGQTFARHLQLGGGQISFYVKERHAQACRRGWTLYPLKSRSLDPLVFYGYETLTTLDEVRAVEWDQVWLCMSSTALKAGWLPSFLPAIKGATLVMLQPGLNDRAAVLELWSEDRLVSGLIGLIAYQAPLKGEKMERVGTAFWFPPLVSSAFSGPGEAVDDIVRTLRLGRCPASKVENVPFQVAQASAMGMPLLVALEGAGWSLRRLRREKDILTLGVAAAREASTIAAIHLGRGAPWRRFLVSRWVIRLILLIAPWFVPFNLETYLQYHFSKVGDQTRAMMETYLREGAKYGLSTVALRELIERVLSVDFQEENASDAVEALTKGVESSDRTQ